MLELRAVDEGVVPASAPATSRLFVLPVAARRWVLTDNTSSEAEITPRVRGGCGWAACWASLSHFLSARLEGGRRLSWAQLPNMCLRFYSDFSTPIRVPLIVVPDSSPRGFGRVMGFVQRVIRQFLP